MKKKSFSIEFSSLNFDQQTTAVYSYRLLGFDEDWVEVSADRRFASYTNLQLEPIRYRSCIRLTKHDERSRKRTHNNY